MVVVLISAIGANVRLQRYEIEGRKLLTHQSIRPRPTADDIESFRRSPSTINRFGFSNPAQAKALGFGRLSI